MGESIEILVQDLDGVLNRFKDLDRTSKAEGVDIKDSMIFLNKIIHEVDEQVKYINRTLNKMQSAERRAASMVPETCQNFGSETGSKSGHDRGQQDLHTFLSQMSSYLLVPVVYIGGGIYDVSQNV